MKKSFFAQSLFVLIALFALNIHHASGQTQEAPGCVTDKCHAGMLKTKNIHPAAQSCDTCHQSIATPHPQKNVKTFKLTDQVPALCYQCHTPFGTKKHIHPPVKDGECTTCHNPHDSAEPKLLVQPLKDLCTSCHPDKVDFKFVHGPTSTGDCTSCHNPHESDNEHLAIAKQPDLCLTCHVDIASDLKKKFIHPALDSGCTSCHNPHGSSVPKFFSAEVPGLCYQCHSDIDDTLKQAKSIHPPVISARSCPTCHSPHASDAPKLLPKSGKDFCLDCHKGLIKKNETVLHGPIKDGHCTPCHNPHGSPNIKLLIKPYSTDFYISYTDDSYQFCFSCHNRDALRFPTTTFATGFRDGIHNLHYLHVNRKDRGKSCRVCHAIHASENPKLIQKSVPFGKWNLPLNFMKTENGGSCAPGCHQKYAYDRKSAVNTYPTTTTTTEEKDKTKSR